MSPEELAAKIKDLIKNVPDFTNGSFTDEKHKWLADVFVLVKKTSLSEKCAKLESAKEQLIKYAGSQAAQHKYECELATRVIKDVLHMALSDTELKFTNYK